MKRLVSALLVALSTASCGERGNERRNEPASLPEGVAARVGSELVRVETVARIARAERVTPEVARERAVSDALRAAGARSFLKDDLVRSVERSALARELLTELTEQARLQGPPSDEELDPIVRERWTEFNRPEAARTTHAVVIAQKPADFAPAAALAAKIAEAVRGVPDVQAFSERAREVPDGGLPVRVEPLPAVTLDGRTFEVGGSPPASAERFDLDFARGALALAVPGQISGPVRSKFGYHVIFLEERLAPKLVPLEERRRILADEVVRRRADAARRELLIRLGSELVVEPSLAAGELTARVSVAP